MGSEPAIHIGGQEKKKRAAKARRSSEERQAIATRIGVPVVLLLLVFIGGWLAKGQEVAHEDAVAAQHQSAVRARSAAPTGPSPQVGVFAARFATAYLTYSGTQDDYQKSLQPFVASTEDTSAWVTVQGEQSVMEVLPVQTTGPTPGIDEATVSALTSNGWLYLDIPIAVFATSMVVAGPPDFVTPPAQGTWQPTGAEANPSSLSKQLQAPMTAFFQNFAGSKQTQLAYETTVPIQGLGGMVVLNKLVSLDVHPGGSTRTAVAVVDWLSYGGVTYQMHYLLHLVLQNGKWLVSAIGSAGTAV